MESSFTFRPIGIVESPFREKFGTPRQPGLVEESRGTIRLRDDLNPDAFEGLEGYSHIWAIFVFHENQSVREGRETVKTKVKPPRLEGQSVGVFASRSPHRPNPIGLSLLTIDKIEGRALHVRGLDLIDGTPILDLKPYLPSIESKTDASEGWSGALTNKTIAVEWAPQALSDITRLYGNSDIRSEIEKILNLDPRPVSYRGTKENPDPYTSRYGFRHGDFNVVFTMLSHEPKKARIERIEPWADPSTIE